MNLVSELAPLQHGKAEVQVEYIGLTSRVESSLGFNWLQVHPFQAVAVGFTLAQPVAPLQHGVDGTIRGGGSLGDDGEFGDDRFSLLLVAARTFRGAVEGPLGRVVASQCWMVETQ